MMQKGFVKYIVIIIAILAIVFFSQLAYFSKGEGKNILPSALSGAGSQAMSYLAKTYDLVASKVYPKISEGAQSGGEAIKSTIDEEKNKISEGSKNILEKAKDYFSGIADSILHPGENNSCQPAPTTSN